MTRMPVVPSGARQAPMVRALTVVVALAMVSVSVTLPPASAQSGRRALPIPDLPGYVTLKADFHLHSVFSDGEVWPTVHVREASRDGLDVVALSEHLEYRPHRADIQGGPMRAYEVARPLADQLGLILVPAVEITRPAPGTKSEWPVGSAHFNVLFPMDVGALDTPELGDALARARDQEAFVFWNHPGFMDQPAQWFPHVAALNRQRLFRGIEVVNGDRFYPEALSWAAEHELTPLACSDAHLPMPAHLTSARRPVTLLFARSRDSDGVREALVARRTLAWLDNRVWGEAEWLAALFQASVAVTEVSDPAGREGRVVRIRNSSAIDFDLRITSSPPWLTLGDVVATGDSVTAVTARPGADAPPGRHVVEIGVEVRNLRSAGDRALSSVLSLPIEIPAGR